jgi:hypothetical protein
MSRRIVSSQFQVSGTAGRVDGYFDRVVKYIPTDVVAAWTAASGLIGSLDDAATPQVNEAANVLWVVFFFGLVVTAVWTWRQTREPNMRPAVTQIIVSTLAFAVWVFALGGPFKALTFYRDQYGALLLIGFTLAIGLIIPPESSQPSNVRGA